MRYENTIMDNVDLDKYLYKYFESSTGARRQNRSINSKLNFQMLLISLLTPVFYLLCFLAFLGPLTKAHSTAIVWPRMSFPSNSSLAARASL